MLQDSAGQPELTQPLGDLLIEVAEHLRSLFANAATHEGLTPVEARVLRLAYTFPEQARLIEALGVAPSRVSALLKSLERRGLVNRAHGPGDRRQRHVEVSASGIASLERIFEYLDRHSPLMTAVDETDRTVLLDILVRLLPPSHPAVNPRPG